MVNLSLYLINQAPRLEDLWGNEGIAPPFFNSALDVGEWSASRTGGFTPGAKVITLLKPSKDPAFFQNLRAISSCPRGAH
jgi:hypothetical protein